jgi:hypothetical protein
LGANIHHKGVLMDSQRPPSPNDSFVTTSLDGRGMSSRQLRVVLTISLVVVLLLASVIFIRFQHGSTIAKQTPFSTSPHGTMAPTTLPSPFIGIGPSDAHSIAIVGDMVYLCGVNTDGLTYLALSSDAGVSWSYRTISPMGKQCTTIAVNPSNTQQIAINMFQCTGQCNPYDPFVTYRSDDAGATWQSMPLPDSSSGQDSVLVWTDDTLWIGCYHGHLLARSIAGRPLQWVDFVGVSKQNSFFLGLFPTQFVLFAVLGGANTPDVFRSYDGGAHWNKVAFHDGNAAIWPESSFADGDSLLGTNTNRTLEQSDDAGTTWHALPAPAEPIIESYQTPDRSIVAAVSIDSSEDAVYLLRPGESQWRAVTKSTQTVSQDLYLAGISWNAAGQPDALWAGNHTDLTDEGFFVYRLKH